MKRIILVFAGLLAIVSPSFAAVNVWTGGAANGLWSDPGNWSLGHVPIAGTEDVTIGDGSGLINLGGNRDVSGVSVSLGNVTLTNGDFVTSSTTTLTGNNTTFVKGDGWFGGGVGTGIQNPSGAGVGDITFNNVSYGRNISWASRDGDTVTINGGSTDWGNSSVVVRGYGGGGTLIFNGGSHYVPYLAINDQAAATGPATLTLMGGASVGVANATAFGAFGVAGAGPATLNLINSTLFIDSGENGWSFGPSAYFNSSYGTLAPRGDFANSMTNQNQWTGYLTFNHVAFDTTKTFEVAGIDYGANTNINTGAGANYSIARLELGDSSGLYPVSWKLVDATDNNTGLAHGSEALYVGGLDLLDDTTIDLNGLHLYYIDLNTNGHTLNVLNGSLTQAIPEPSSVGLAVFGSLLFLRRKARA